MLYSENRDETPAQVRGCVMPSPGKECETDGRWASWIAAERLADKFGLVLAPHLSQDDDGNWSVPETDTAS